AAPAPATRGGLVIFVTDMTGAPIRDVRVQAVGPTERGGPTDGGGRLTITGMQAGTYRLRFTNDAFTEFEREVVVRGGPNTEVDVSLRPAPPPKVVTVTEAAPPPPPAAPTVGPLGQPQTIAAIATLVTKEFLTGPRREAMISCSGNTRLALVQMTEEQPVRLYENAEVMYYVLGGEGVARVAGRETILKQESLVFLPRGTSHSLSHRGRRNVPLILVSVLSGEPCEQAR
ncbi:MAG: carboxypeptidase regulatory-like domain-containing protein, partial [Vicinamibacterales bacterium]